MKAAVYYQTGGPEVFRYEELPDPVCRPGGLLVDVKAVGIQGGDVLHRAGGELATTPHVVGYQAAGVVREAGAGVASFAPGDRVVATMAFGSHASVVSVPARAAYAVPEGLSLEEAAAVPIEFATAHDCLFEFGHLQPGELVLVQAGASGVGLAAIQLAKLAGATVLATASSDVRLARLKGFGLDRGINYASEDFVGRTFELTDGHGADLIVDSVGGRTLEGSVAALAYRGRISWVGRAGREVRIPDVSAIMQKNASLTGVYLGGELAAQPDRCRAMIESLLERVARRHLRVALDRAFALSEAAAAHAYIESRQAFGRVLLVPESSPLASPSGLSGVA